MARALIVMMVVAIVPLAVAAHQPINSAFPIAFAPAFGAAIDYPSGWPARALHASLILFLVLSLTFVLRHVLESRKSTGVRRQQLKSMLSGGAVCLAGLLISVFAGGIQGRFWYVLSNAASLGIIALPIGIGVGILRYRLYEIDRLISRTLSYAALTALLVGVFVGIVTLTTRVLPFSSPVAVATSTLAATALFNPLRQRVRRLVDRRFNRARYDAAATVAAFTARLRDALDRDTVRNELVHSLLHLRGMPWARIGEFVGQRDLSVTADTYTHAMVDETELDYSELLG